MEIKLEGISRHYPLKKALDDVSVTFASGKLHALFGENGAGKSTLAKIISGSLLPTAGKIFIDDKPVHFSNSKDALAYGIVIVEQTPLLSLSLTAYENLLLKSKEKKLILDYNVPDSLLSLRDSWCPKLDFSSKVRDLGGNFRFYVSLLGALLRKPKCLILDEPSAFLDFDERKKLYDSLKKLTASGTTVIVITHSASEAKTYADTITFLKKGKRVSEENFHASQENAVSFPDFNFSKTDASSSPLSLTFNHLSCRPPSRPALLDATLTVKAGEITAVTGLKESSIDTLEDALTGMEKNNLSGQVSFTNSQGAHFDFNLSKGEWSVSFLREHGTAIVPSDRKLRGSNPNLTVTQMLCAHYKGKNLSSYAQQLIDEANISIMTEEKCSSLSGGMLQRLILVRELSLDPSLVILCNPMQGLDIRSQAFFTKTIVSLAESGKAVLVIGASDMPLTICSRVYALESGVCRLSFSKENV